MGVEVEPYTSTFSSRVPSDSYQKGPGVEMPEGAIAGVCERGRFFWTSLSRKLSEGATSRLGGKAAAIRD